MKKLIISAAVLAFSFSFAQKKEIQSALKAAEGGNSADALAQISAADNTLGGKLYTLDPEVQEQYYYAKGLALLKSGKTTEGAEILGKLADLGKAKIYTGKDANKNKVYFVGKADADKYGAGLELKETTYAPTLTNKLIEALKPTIDADGNEAMKAYQEKNYKVAGDKFAELNDLLKAIGQPDQIYQYYSAVAYALGKNNDLAIKQYTSLIDSGYTGVQTKYLAKNKKTNQVENIGKANYDLFQKLGAASEYTDFKTETAPSVEQELYDTATGLMIDSGKYDDALTVISKGLKKFPNDSKLTSLQGTAYYKSGKTDEFINNLKAVVAKNPSDKESWYNLGVLQSKSPATVADAETSFKKALEVDPNYIAALQGIFYNVYMGDDAKVIDDYNAAKKAGKIEVANKILGDRKARFTKALPYVEKWYQIEPKSKDAVSALKGVYFALGNMDKYNQLKAIEATLK